MAELRSARERLSVLSLLAMWEHEVRSDGRGARSQQRQSRNLGAITKYSQLIAAITNTTSPVALSPRRLVRWCYHQPPYLWSHSVLITDFVCPKDPFPRRGNRPRSAPPVAITNTTSSLADYHQCDQPVVDSTNAASPLVLSPLRSNAGELHAGSVSPAGRRIHRGSTKCEAMVEGLVPNNDSPATSAPSPDAASPLLLSPLRSNAGELHAGSVSPAGRRWRNSVPRENAQAFSSDSSDASVARRGGGLVPNNDSPALLVLSPDAANTLVLSPDAASPLLLSPAPIPLVALRAHHRLRLSKGSFPPPGEPTSPDASWSRSSLTLSHAH